MSQMARLLDWIGNILLVLAFLVITTGSIAIGIFQGLGRLWDVLSPFNLVNWFVVLVALAPGFGLKVLSRKLRERR